VDAKHINIKTSSVYFDLLSATLSNVSREVVEAITDCLADAYFRRSSIFTFGNGGSASLASHVACDLAKGASDPASKRKGLRVTALTDNIPMITAWANDLSYDEVFAQQLRNFAEPGDVAMAISCSGNSPNVLKALSVARELGAMTIGLGGFAGGKMKSLCDICLVVPSDNMQIIEDVHLSVAHALFTIVRNRIAMEREARAVAAGMAR
jgi:D-sedoheptulose 7-phosphate isomerase